MIQFKWLTGFCFCEWRHISTTKNEIERDGDTQIKRDSFKYRLHLNSIVKMYIDSGDILCVYSSSSNSIQVRFIMLIIWHSFLCFLLVLVSLSYSIVQREKQINARASKQKSTHTHLCKEEPNKFFVSVASLVHWIGSRLKSSNCWAGLFFVCVFFLSVGLPFRLFYTRKVIAIQLNRHTHTHTTDNIGILLDYIWILIFNVSHSLKRDYIQKVRKYMCR